MGQRQSGIERKLEIHLDEFFAGHSSERHVWGSGPMRQVLPNFHVMAFGPGPKSALWTYCSVGAWEIAKDEESPRLEFLMFSEHDAPRLTELVTMIAYYHRDYGLGRGHTLGLGEPWLPGSTCNSLLISTPYPLGPELELFEWDGGHVHFLWALPITEAERALKVSEGLEALEARFDSAAIEYWDPTRPSVA